MDSSSLLVTFGAAVISALVTTVVFLYKKWDKERDARLNDAKEVNKKITGPLADLTEVSQKIYDALPEVSKPKRKRGK